MDKFKKAFYNSTQFVSKHRTSIAVATTVATMTYLHKKTIDEINERLVFEYNIDLDAFYDPGI